MRRLGGSAVPRPLGPVNPFELEILVTAAWYGSLLLLGTTRSNAIRQALPPPMQVVWAGLLLVGGVLSIAGLLWPGNPFNAIEIKRVGLVAAGVAALAYAVALFGLGWDGAGIGGGYLGFSAACAWRVVQIRTALRRSVEYLHTETRRRRLRPGGG